MRRVAIDTETHLTKPGMLFPKLVCVSVSDGKTKQLYLAADGVKVILDLLKDPDVILIGHNMAYDIGIFIAEAIDLGYDPHMILSLVFAAYDADRIVDTMIRAMLVDIAQGDFQEVDGQRRGRVYGLDLQADRWLGIKLQKKDTWRLHYAFLQNTPLAQWPPEASEYAIKDAEITWLVDQAITTWAISEGMPTGVIPDEHRQVRAALVLHLMAGWGVHIDSDLVKLVKENLECQRTASYEIMEHYGIFKKDKLGNYKRTKKGQICKDQKRIKQLIEEGYASRGKKPPQTAGRVDKKTGIRTPETGISADTARDSGHVACIALADVANADKLLSTFIPVLERGAGGMPVTSSPNVLVSSGRTSWTQPNWQQPPRLGGVRECVIPRPGKVFVSADLDTVELRALAQSCLRICGFSAMAIALQAGEDLHLSLAAEIGGISYAKAQKLYAAGDPWITELRQTSKIVNFGLGGGMGARKFAQAQIDAGTPLIKDPNAPFSDHVNRAQQLKEAWFKKWPEMRKYLQNAGDVSGDHGSGTVEQLWSGRIRGGLDYCSCANTLFQGLVADGVKLALWRLAYACYVDKSSPLYGARMVLFLHDEVILECLEDRADACAAELVKIMCSAVQEVIPDVPITSSATISRRWLKGSKPVLVNGKLVAGKPQKDATGKTKWVYDDGT